MASVHGEGDGPSQYPQEPYSWPLEPYGVWGDSSDNIGVLGTCDRGCGVLGWSGKNQGVCGISDTGQGVYAASQGTAIFAEVTAANGVGVAGFSGFGRGGTGVVGSGGNAGVAAFNPNNHNAAYLASDCCAAWFTGQVHIDGDFTVAGRKAAMVKHPDGAYRRLYSVESPESWFEDFGTGRLQDGHANVELDREFAALVHCDSYHVFLTSYGDSGGLYVAERRTDGFVVREQQGGKHTLEFAYHVVAKRSDITVKRLEPVQLHTEPTKPPTKPPVRIPPKSPQP